VGDQLDLIAAAGGLDQPGGHVGRVALAAAEAGGLVEVERGEEGDLPCRVGHRVRSLGAVGRFGAFRLGPGAARRCGRTRRAAARSGRWPLPRPAGSTTPGGSERYWRSVSSWQSRRTMSVCTFSGDCEALTSKMIDGS